VNVAFLAYALTRWGLYGHALWQCARLMHSVPGSYVQAPHGRVVRTRAGLAFIPQAVIEKESRTPEVRLEIASREAIAQWPETGVTVTSGGTYSLTLLAPPINIATLAFSPEILYIDLSEVRFPLTVRPWQQGDRMTPLGMTGSKLLSDIFADEKWDASQKAAALVVADAKGIVALTGFRIAAHVRVRDGRIGVLRVEKMPTFTNLNVTAP